MEDNFMEFPNQVKTKLSWEVPQETSGGIWSHLEASRGSWGHLETYSWNLPFWDENVDIS